MMHYININTYSLTKSLQNTESDWQ